MYNFLKNLFGIPSNNSETRNDDNLRNDFRNPIWGSDDYSDDDEDFRSNSSGNYGGFGFPIFTDSIEIHKFFEHQMDEMRKRFGMFGFHGGNSINLEEGWDTEGSIVSPFHGIEHEPNLRGNLRDSYLKQPGYLPNDVQTKADVNLDGKLGVDDVRSFLNNSTQTNEIVPTSPQPNPNVYAKSVFIRTIRRPDGSVETVRKVRDHTGKEETTVTHDFLEPNNPVSPVLEDIDISGSSIFRKFFPF